MWAHGTGLAQVARAALRPAVEPYSLTCIRSFYFPRKNWYPWRARRVQARKRAVRLKRHIWPRYFDPNEKPIFQPIEAHPTLAFQQKYIRVSVKKMLEYTRLISGKQLEDAIHWIEALSRPNAKPVLDLMKKAREECVERYRWDLARVFLFNAQVHRGFFVKSVKLHIKGKFGMQKSPRSTLLIRLREMPLEEFFHKLYINHDVPKTVAMDMRLALTQRRASPQMEREWLPYLTSTTRFFHRKDLKWLDSTRQFDYYQVRREWIAKYQANQNQAVSEAREARGLPTFDTEGMISS